MMICSNPFQQLTFTYISSIIRSINSDNFIDPLEDKHTSKFRDLEKKYFKFTEYLKCNSCKLSQWKIMSENQLLSTKQICELFGNCNRSKIHRLMQNDEFPKPLKFGRNNLWKGKVIQEYINAMEEGQ